MLPLVILLVEFCPFTSRRIFGVSVLFLFHCFIVSVLFCFMGFCFVFGLFVFFLVLFVLLSPLL